MENLVFTQLSVPEIKQIFRQELDIYFSAKDLYTSPQNEIETFLTVEEAAKFLRLSKATVYSLISKQELPVIKRSKRCYFSKIELINYLKQGRKKTLIELSNEALSYLNDKKKRG